MRLRLGASLRILSVVLAGLTALKQAQAQGAGTVSGIKEPAVARSNALYMPGGGYLYTGEYARAAAALGVTVIGVYNLAGELGCSVASNSLLGADTGCSGGKKVLWLAASVVPYIWGIIDAPNSAARANEKSRSGRQSFALVEQGPAGGTHVGLRITFH